MSSLQSLASFVTSCCVQFEKSRRGLLRRRKLTKLFALHSFLSYERKLCHVGALQLGQFPQKNTCKLLSYFDWQRGCTASICWSTLKNMKKENKCQNKILNNLPPKLIRQTNLVIGGNGLPFLIELSFLFWPLQIPANGSEQKNGRKRINDQHDRSKSFLFGLVIKI